MRKKDAHSSEKSSIKSNKLVFLLIPAAVLLIFLFVNLQTVVDGKEAKIKVVRPIDPIDIFRGNYAILNYDFSTVEIGENNILSLEERETLYAVLQDSGDLFEISYYSKEKPDLAENEICLRGTVQSVWNDRATVSYGIESFFSTPEIAKEIEDARNQDKVVSVVKADNDCDAVLTSLLVDGDLLKNNI